MQKQLIILLYKINVEGLTKTVADEYLDKLVEDITILKDDEVKENYIIREIFLAVTDEPSDIKVIYPIPKYTTELNNIIKDISDKINQYANSDLKQQWERIVRELKIKNLQNE